jgi:glycosyltransferase involved in cell wall biosynthesis
MRPDSRVVPQGFDIDSYIGSVSEKERKKIQKEFSHIPKPRVGYVGNITYRFDFPLLFSLAQKMKNVSFIFVGDYLSVPHDDAFRDTRNQLEKLKFFSNVHILPRRSREKVKETMSYFDICMIPYDASLDFNKYCFPMKLFEYFYLGKPVLSTPIDELKRFTKYVSLGVTVMDWSNTINELLVKKWPISYRNEQKTLAVVNSYSKKVSMILNIVDNKALLGRI